MSWIGLLVALGMLVMNCWPIFYGHIFLSLINQVRLEVEWKFIYQKHRRLSHPCVAGNQKMICFTIWVGPLLKRKKASYPGINLSIFSRGLRSPCQLSWIASAKTLSLKRKCQFRRPAASQSSIGYTIVSNHKPLCMEPKMTWCPVNGTVSSLATNLGGKIKLASRIALAVLVISF